MTQEELFAHCYTGALLGVMRVRAAYPDLYVGLPEEMIVDPPQPMEQGDAEDE